MDIATVAQALVAAAGEHLAAGASAAADSAGAQAWALLVQRLRTTRLGAHVLDTLELRPDDPAARTSVEQAALDQAEQDPRFEGELRGWAARLDQVATAQGAIGAGSTARGGVNVTGAPNGRLSLRGIIVGGDHVDQSQRSVRVNTGGLLAIGAAVAVALLGGTVVYSAAAPYAGFTESARVDRLEGRWVGTTDKGKPMVLVVRADGSASFTSDDWPCAGIVTSPARYEYVLTIDCGLLRMQADAELDLLGTQLTLVDPASRNTTALDRD